MRMDWDKDKNQITIGKAVFSSYMNFKNSQAFAREVFRLNDIPYPSRGAGWLTVERGDYESLDDLGISDYIQSYVAEEVPCKPLQKVNKEVGDILGCSYATLYRHFQKLQFKAFVAPVYHLYKYVNTWQHKRGIIVKDTLERVWQRKDILEPVYKDGLYNLLPIVAETGLTPQELKKELKGGWKIVAGNSRTRNIYIARGARSRRSGLTWLTTKAPTTLIQHGIPIDKPGTEYLASNFKGHWKDRRKMFDELRMFTDTEMLAGQLGIQTSIKPTWTPRRLKEEHDRLAKLVNQKRFSPEKYESLRGFPVERFEHEGYVATLLDSALLIAEEGSDMGHCVAGYTSCVKSGTYLVYSVSKDGQKSSTIGINRLEGSPQRVVVQQHYGKYNAHLKDENEKALARLLELEINNQLKGNEHE